MPTFKLSPFFAVAAVTFIAAPLSFAQKAADDSPASWFEPFIDHLAKNEIPEAHALLSDSAQRYEDLDSFRATVTRLNLTGFKSFEWVHADKFERFGRYFASARCRLTLKNGSHLELNILAEENGGTFEIAHFRVHGGLGPPADSLLALPADERLEITRRILASFAESNRTRDYLGFAKFWTGKDLEDGAKRIETGFAAFQKFDLSFLPDADIKFSRISVTDAGELHLDGSASSDAAMRRFGFTSVFVWEKDTWMLNSYNGTIAYKPDATLTETPPAKELLALASETLAAWKNAVLEGKLKEFGEAHSSSFFLEKVDGPDAFVTWFDTFRNPDFHLAELDPSTIDFADTSIHGEHILVLKGTADSGPNRLGFTLEFYREKDTWKIAGISASSKEKGDPPPAKTP